MLRETILEGINKAEQKDNTDKLSHMQLCQRVEKTRENEYGFLLVDTIPPDKPTVLVLGGNDTITNRAANGYMSDMEDLLKKYKLDGKVGIYSIIYDLKRNDFYERKKLFQDHFRPTTSKYRISNDKYYKFYDDGTFTEFPFPADANNPNYVKELFNKAFLSRITDKDGNKLPVDEACKRMRNLTVCAHCHGGHVFLKIEELLLSKMREIGFSDEERAKIQKELLCVAYAPEAPLGVSKSTMISFASIRDSKLSTENNFEKELFRLQNDFDVAYFPGKQGEVFVASKVYNYVDNGFLSDKDHSFLTPTVQEGELTEAGTVFNLFFYNALIAGIKGSIEEKPLSSIKELICGKNEKNIDLFEKVKENGRILWDKIVQNTKIRSVARRKKQNA